MDEDDDRCGTLSFILVSSNILTRIWNCSRSTYDDCNETATCDYMKELAAGIDDTVDSCSLTCCEGDGCNDPGKMKGHVFISVHASCLSVHASFSTACTAAQKDLNKTKAAGVYCICPSAVLVSCITHIFQLLFYTGFYIFQLHC